jgi:hypothetical protein
VLLIYSMIPRNWAVVDGWPTFGLLESIAILGLCKVLRDAYSTEILQVWYVLIDIHFIVFHAKFKDGLSIPIRIKRDNFTQKCTTGNREMSNVCWGLPACFIQSPPFSNFCVRRSRLGMQEFPIRLKYIRKSKVMEMVSSRFYWLDEIMIKLHEKLAMEKLI